MKKTAKYVILLIVLAAFTFGAGVGLAEIKLRYFLPQKTTIIPANNSVSAPIAEKKEDLSVGGTAPEAMLPETENIEGATEPAQKTEEEKSFSFGVIGDTQYFSGSGGGLVDARKILEKNDVKLAFAMGDLVSSCSNVSECIGKYRTWKGALGSLASKTYAMQGNHDRTGKDKADEAWNASFNFPKNGPAGFQNQVYSFDYENSHFVVLDSDKPKENIINDTQRGWLEGDLARNKKTNTFVFFHEPAWPVSSKVGESLDVENKDRNALWDILVRHRVTAVFSGHEHIASRKNVNGVYQFVFGNTQSFSHESPRPGMSEYSYVGQNFGIVTVSGRKINVKTYSTSGNAVNSFDFQK